MLQTSEVGQLFAVMHGHYGRKWDHGADDIPIWQNKLKSYRFDDVMKAAMSVTDIYPEWPPSSGEFSALVRESQPALPAPESGPGGPDPDRIYAYTKPASKSNPAGNPHHVFLPDSIAQRQVGEPAEQYRQRISNAVTLAMYPQLQATRY